MDILDLKDELERQFGNTFKFHPKFYEEFVDLISGTGYERKIILQFLRRLRSIIELGNIDCGLKWLEKLKKHENMYSLHIDECSTNYRLLFSKVGERKYFLRMFYEKDRKKNTSYDLNVEIAIVRRDKDNE